jgi:precorrin isomerase
MTIAMHAYLREPESIYARSFALIEAEAGAALAALPAELRPVARRLIHSCGMTDIPTDLAWSGQVVTAARNALESGAALFCDVEMVKAGIIRRRLPAAVEPSCTLADPEVPALATMLGTTRSAAAVELWRKRLNGAVVVIGNAPTALFHLLERLALWPERPAAIFAFPVGFVGAAESKDALIAASPAVPFLTLRGRRGGSAMAAAAVNALWDPQR